MWILLSYLAIGLLIAYIAFRCTVYTHAEMGTSFDTDDVGMLGFIFIAWPLFGIIVVIFCIIDFVTNAGKNQVKLASEQLRKEREIS